MPEENLDLEKGILQKYRNVAIVGLSPDPERYSNQVACYLLQQGYNIIPVNPAVKEVLGKLSYPDLSAIPEPVEIVDIFRSSDKVMPIVEEAIKIKAKVVWMQESVVNEEAAARARAAGLFVVMDRCMKKMHQRLIKSIGDVSTTTEETPPKTCKL